MVSTDDQGDFVYRSSFYSKKAGRRIYAWEYGKKAFKIPVKKKRK